MGYPTQINLMSRTLNFVTHNWVREVIKLNIIIITKSSKIYIAGHKGMVGRTDWRALIVKGYTNLIGKTSKELDLRNQTAVNNC